MSNDQVNLRGPLFLSHRSTSKPDIDKLNLALRHHGIPTFIDSQGLGYEHTETAIREVLQSPDTAGAVIYVTPDMADRPYINIELTEIAKRVARDTDFKLVGIIAPGFKVEDATEMISRWVSLDFMANHLEILDQPGKSEPGGLTSEDAARIARKIVKQRLAAIDAVSGRERPFRVRINTHTSYENERDPELDLDLQLTDLLPGRLASEEQWRQQIVPIVRSSLNAAAKSRRELRISGEMPSALATLVGMVTGEDSATITFDQTRTSNFDKSMPLGTGDSGGTSPTIIRDALRSPGPSDIAILLNLAQGPQEIEKPRLETPGLPQMRAVITVDHANDTREARSFKSSAEIAAAADEIVERLQKIRKDCHISGGGLHLFAAAPNSLMIALGYRLRSCADFVHTYDFVPGNGGGETGVKPRYQRTVSVTRRMVQAP